MATSSFAVGPNQAVLSWDPSSDPTVTGTYLHYGTLVDDVSTEFPKIALPVGVSSYELTSLEDDVTYFFYVTAYNSAGVESEPSNRVIFRGQSTTQGHAAEIDLSLLTTNSLLAGALDFAVVGGQPEQGAGTLLWRSGTSQVYCAPNTPELAIVHYRFDEQLAGHNFTEALVAIDVAAVAAGMPVATPPNTPVTLAPGEQVEIPLLGRDTNGETLYASSIQPYAIPQAAGAWEYGQSWLRYTARADYLGQFSFTYQVLSADGYTVSLPATVVVRVVPQIQLTQVSLTNGEPTLDLEGPGKGIYNIHRSADLKSWQLLMTAVGTNDLSGIQSMRLIDSTAAGAPMAFYRTEFVGYAP